jgi:geranylgeranyl diphosphate synthase type I
MVETISSLLSGGKRLRPAFCYWGWRGAGGADHDPIVRAATSLELLQACALIHDDVMDGSDTRRGLPAAHRRSRPAPRATAGSVRRRPSGRRRHPARRPLPVLGRRACCSAPGSPGEALLRAKPVLRRDAHRADVRAVPRPARAGDRRRLGRAARRVIRFKSAKYTVERPLHLGAALAGADDALLRTYTAYGLPLGEAFQLRDDVLGVFGDPGETGKPAGDDLREGKRTVLVATALEQASPADAALLRGTSVTRTCPRPVCRRLVRSSRRRAPWPTSRR